MSPVLPADAKALIVQPEDDLCAMFKKLLLSFRLAYRYERYKRADSGALSTAFCAEIKTCAANMPTTTT